MAGWIGFNRTSSDPNSNYANRRINAMNKISARISARVIFCSFASFNITTAIAQDSIAPPSIGQETKGTPAVDEVSQNGDAKHETTASDQPESKNSATPSIFGNATFTESRRESGQLYMIELEHSSGSKQYIEQTGSDTKIESTSNDIEETPNLPKWKIGSW